jgi:addiction module RelE/StbE family toxin
VIVEWTERAVSHLEQIRAYIAKDSPRNADAFIDRLIRRTEILSDQPLIGAIVDKYAARGCREVLEPPYRIIYRVREDKVQVLAVIHGARRLPRSLG